MGSAVYGEKELRGGQQNETGFEEELWVLLPSKGAVGRVGEVGASEKAVEENRVEVKALAGEDPHVGWRRWMEWKPRSSHERRYAGWMGHSGGLNFCQIMPLIFVSVPPSSNILKIGTVDSVSFAASFNPLSQDQIWYSWMN